MCRIAGIIDQHQHQEQLKLDIQSMCNVMAHGGPDDEGFYQSPDNDLLFGHRRLALIDLSEGGHQPMVYENKYVISFNGEIYNYLILKEELQNEGFQFKSKSDTEVILAGFAHWGLLLFEKLKGMFAFALYDITKKTTYLVRDQSGIKPLYYSTDHNRLVFASEVKAFKNIAYQYEENPDWKIYFLAFGHIPEPYTTLNGVFSLPKAHFLIWNHESKKAEITSYLIEKTSPRVANKYEADTLVKNILEKSVSQHLISDAPIGVFLSGGIDSSLLTLIANQLQQTANQNLHTISINFDHKQFSEEQYQQIVLDQIKSHHASYTLNEAIFSEYFPKALVAMDQPTNDGINSWFVNFFAKENGLKAVLSGIGADELFGGYPSFKRMRLVKILSLLPNYILRQSKKINKQGLKRAYYLSYRNTIGKYLFLRGFFTPDEISALLNISVSKVDHILKNLSSPAIPQGLEKEEQASWLETNLYMQNQLLKDTDAMSMQHGVEVRVPYLDSDLIQAIKSIKNELKYKGSQPKSLLIDAFNNLLPRKIWDRPKMGFTFPFQYWLKTNPHFLNSLAGIENKKANNLIADFKNGNLHWSKAMALYQVFNT
ncbi:asparagine synthase (glutamine-hydrolyzing) [Pedobacter punctiformis]|uniref:asparagine synthase (glutamine-hydrolyzing) n=1 Tax=Pedobacter punctiformis TaxID=3004097 RepID=A0ABT4LA16_9SPHI|nr:asparagine synthase (glutamine-hydrolyzing) [Pedobacter sp. HCMS5-2]MCZ4244691.1 asparagine synthase (glutamine-hydrolyzing) [Pedobacter sp. HCMS5-2]